MHRDTPSFGALIDGDASVMEYIRLENLTKRKNAWRERDKKLKVGIDTILFSDKSINSF